jgi:hypothetical protein
MRDWESRNPQPEADTASEEKAGYWEEHVRMSNDWVKRLREDPAIWIDRLQALAELRKGQMREIRAAADRSSNLIGTFGDSRLRSGASDRNEQKLRLHCGETERIAASRGLVCSPNQIQS